MSIIISQKGEKSQKIDKSNFDKEDYLQNYIHENPESIPVYEIEEDKKLFVVAREFSTESGSIDALAIDKDGDIYVVETKLYKNPDKRTVVAQALDYGASLWRHSSYDQLISKIEKEIENKFKLSLNDKLKDFFNIDEEEVSSLLESLKDNLQTGNIKFVVLMDIIAERLKDLIVYINQNSQFDIFAVSMEYYKFDKYEIMIPRLFGVEVKKNIIKSSSQRKKWEEDEFLVDAKNKLNENEYIALRKLFNFCKENTNIIGLGTGIGSGSISPIFNEIEKSIFTLRSNGRINFHISHAYNKLNNQIIKNKLKLVSKKLEKIGIIAPFDKGKFRSKEAGNYRIKAWMNKTDKIIEILDEAIK